MSQTDLDRIQELHRRDIQATRSRDFKTLRSLFTEDAVLMPPGGERKSGSEELDRSFAAMREAYSRIEILEYEQVWEEIEVRGETAFEWGMIRGSMRSLPDGDVEKSRHHVMRILKRQADGAWRIHRSIWNDVEGGAD